MWRCRLPGPRGFNLHISIDGNRWRNTHLPKAGSNPMMMRFGPPDEYGFTINYDAPEEPNANARMYSIGYCQPQGEPAEYSNFRILKIHGMKHFLTTIRFETLQATEKLVPLAAWCRCLPDASQNHYDRQTRFLSARLYATARGVYEFTINGHMVGKDFLNPGWTDYRYRIMYNTIWYNLSWNRK